MKKIADNLYAISGKGFYSTPVFVLEKSNGKLTLIDTGLAKDTNTIIKKIKQKWNSLENIERIIFTHEHLDHTQGLIKILDEMATISAEAPPHEKIEIIVHKDEESQFINDFKKYKIKPNRLIIHEEIIDKDLDIKAIHTPGHSFGHICLLLEKQKIILIGDIIMFMFKRLMPTPKKFHDNYKQYLESLPIILDYEWNFAIPSHIKPKKIPREKIEKYIMKMKRKQK